MDTSQLLNDEMTRAERLRDQSTVIILAALEVVRTSQSLRRQTTFGPAQESCAGPNT